MSLVDAQPPASSRIAIARLAERVVAADPGVGPAASGGVWLTRDGDRVIPGVVAVAGAGGRVGVELHLVAYLPARPLERQVKTLRAEIRAAADATGLAEALGPVDVTIHDLRQSDAAGASA